jgi:hypothetical protein
VAGTALAVDPGMTQPRNVRPGVTWLTTRRATRRYFLFTPDEQGLVEQVYWYATAVIAQQLGIELHMMQLMSTHPHEVLTDTRGVLPRFFELRNRVFANAIKVLRGWPEEVFSKEPCNWVELETPEAMIQEMAYVAANCVAAGLVRTPRRWPGAKVLVDDVGRRVVKVSRPDFYFDPNNPNWPDEVAIPIVMPKMLTDTFGSEQAAREAIQAKLDELIRKAHAENKRAGRGYAGHKRVLKTPHTTRARSYEHFGSRTPTFAAAGNAAVAANFIRRRREFLEDYRRAWISWRAGERDIVFPFGTWKMRHHHAAPCHSPP